MNDRGRQVLIEAQLRGVRQIKRAYRSGDGRCAVGVLFDNLEDKLDYNLNEYSLLKAKQKCLECEKAFHNERSLIVHLNDTHGYDFLTIARKLPDTEPLTD